MSDLSFNPLAEFACRTRHRGIDAGGVPELSLAGTIERVSRALSTGEHDAAGWQSRFEGFLAGSVRGNVIGSGCAGQLNCDMA